MNMKYIFIIVAVIAVFYLGYDYYDNFNKNKLSDNGEQHIDVTLLPSSESRNIDLPASVIENNKEVDDNNKELSDRLPDPQDSDGQGLIESLPKP